MPPIRPAVAFAIVLLIGSCVDAPQLHPPAVARGNPPAFDCDETHPATAPIIGTAEHGAYEYQLLPGEFARFHSEGDVTAGIRDLELGKESTWTCFRRSFSGALSVYWPLWASPSPTPFPRVGWRDVVPGPTPSCDAGSRPLAAQDGTYHCVARALTPAPSASTAHSP